MTSKRSRDTRHPETAALVRYLSGESPLPEAESIRAWLAEDPRRHASLHELLRAWNASPPALPEWDRAGVWQTVASALHETQPTSHTADSADSAAEEVALRRPRVPRTWSSRGGMWGRIPSWPGVLAAAAAIAVVVIVTVPHGSSRGTTPSVQVRSYHTDAGQRATVQLSDGSRVTLAPRTSLRVASGFGVENRTVELTGEAYFDVQHAARRPFIVRTGKVRTQVLGTAFTVRRYERDTETRVAVASGRVSAGSTEMPDTPGVVVPHPSVILSAGMIGQVTDSTATAKMVGDVSEYTGWTNGQLVFRRTPVPEVLATLERWYGFRFQLRDSALVSQHLTVTFDRSTPADMLVTLKALLHVTMTFDGNVVTLIPRADVPSPAPTRDSRNSMHSTSMREVGR